MIEKIKFEMWDFFIYFVTGILLILNLSIYKYQLVIQVLGRINDVQIPSFISTILFLLIPVLLGYIVEPLSNAFGKLNRKFFKFKSLKEWDDSINSQFSYISTFIPNIKGNDNIFHYCKHYLLQQNVANPSMDFLSKFGFYRNISFIFLINSLYLIYTTIITESNYILISLILFYLSQQYQFRSIEFLKHQSQTVVQNFIILQENKIAGNNKA